MNIIKPQVTRGMYQWNCASIPSRGTIYAKDAVQKWVRTDYKNTKYALKLDVKKYFENIKLMKELIRYGN
jgi:hypothetical protein